MGQCVSKPLDGSQENLSAHCFDDAASQRSGHLSSTGLLSSHLTSIHHPSIILDVLPSCVHQPSNGTVVAISPSGTIAAVDDPEAFSTVNATSIFLSVTLLNDSAAQHFSLSSDSSPNQYYANLLYRAQFNQQLGLQLMVAALHTKAAAAAQQVHGGSTSMHHELYRLPPQSFPASASALLPRRNASAGGEAGETGDSAALAVMVGHPIEIQGFAVWPASGGYGASSSPPSHARICLLIQHHVLLPLNDAAHNSFPASAASLPAPASLDERPSRAAR